MTREPQAPQSDVTLICDHLPLVNHLVREVMARVPQHVASDDLRSAGMLALVQAARAFDPSLQVPFSRFASCRIRGALLDELRSVDWASRSVRRREREVEVLRARLRTALGRTPSGKEVAAAGGLTLVQLREHDNDVARASIASTDSLADSDGAQTMAVSLLEPVHVLLHRERMAYLCDAVQQLPPRLRTVVEGYFFQERPMADIAAELGVSDSRISQMRADAVALMRHALDTLLEQEEPPVDEGPGIRSRRRAAYVRDVAQVRPAMARLTPMSYGELPRPA